MKNKKHISQVITLSLALIVSSCGNTKQDNLDDTDDVKTVNTLDSQKISAQNVFNSLPNRTAIITLTQNSKADYNADILNDPNKASSYSLESSKALNLGVYGADLNVASVFEQTQESMLFLKCVNILAKSLGVSNAFDEKMVDRMEVNKENRDSTMEIITHAFKKCDKILVANGRPGTSTLIVAGAWVEGIFIATNSAKSTKNEAVVKEIFAQTESLGYLIEMLKHTNIATETTYILEGLTKLQAELTSKTDTDFSVTALKNVDEKITVLRNQIINNK